MSEHLVLGRSERRSGLDRRLTAATAGGLQALIASDASGDEMARAARGCAERLAACAPGPELISALTVLGDSAVPPDAFVDEAVLAAWDRVRAWVESRFYAAVTGFASADDSTGVQLERVRCALGLSRQGAANVILVSRRLAETFPATMAQLQAGKVTHKHVWALIDTTRLLTEEEAAKVEEATREEAPEQTVAEYRRALDRARVVAAPEYAERAITARVTGRGVSRWTDRDGQPKLLANLPAEDLAAAWEALCARADASRQPGDPRGHAARMADALTEALTGHPAAYDPRRNPATPTTPDDDLSIDATAHVTLDATAHVTLDATAHVTLDATADVTLDATADVTLDGPVDASIDARPEPATPMPDAVPRSLGPDAGKASPTAACARARSSEAAIEIHVVVPAARIAEQDVGPPPSAASPPARTGVPDDQGGRSGGARQPRRVRRGRVLTSRSFATIGIESLLGRVALPGELSGNGWVPASLIRRLAQGDVLLRRLVVDEGGHLLDAEHTVALPAGRQPDEGVERALLGAPYRGEPLDYGTTAYRLPAVLWRQIALRDRTCQVPGCGQPAWRTDIDHAIPFPRGTTSERNCGALCRRHHRLKSRFGWQLVRLPGGGTLWVSPAGLAKLRRAYSYLRFLS